MVRRYVCLCIVCVFLLAGLAASSESQERQKNGAPSTSPSAGGVPLVVPPGLPFGARVRAVVDYPSDSTCIVAGDEGTVFCYDELDDVLPYLVEWEGGCGFAQSGCGVVAEHGWWVGFDEIEVIADSTATPTPSATVTAGTPTSRATPGLGAFLPLLMGKASGPTPSPTMTPSGTSSPSATPTITPTDTGPGQATLLSSADATVSSNLPDTNLGDTTDMWAGYDDNPDTLLGIVRALVRFDLSSIPDGVTVTSAHLRVYCFQSWDYPDRSRTIQAYEVAKAWDEMTVTWNNQPAFGDGYGTADIVHGEYGWVELDVTDLVQDWLDGSQANSGIMVRGDENTSADSGHRDFVARETSGETYDPRLVIAYQ